MTEVVLAVVLGLLFAAGTFLILRRDVVRVAWGVVLLGQAANVYLVTMGGLEGSAPIVAHGAEGAATPTDPLVQALVLTAIVIGFGTTAFLLVLTYRLYEEHGTIDVTEIGAFELRERDAAPAGRPGPAGDVTTDGGSTADNPGSATDGGGAGGAAPADGGEPDG